MQKFFIQTNKINFLIFLLILLIPFYQIRLDLKISSISILSFAEIILIIFGIFVYKKKLKNNYLNNYYLFNLIFGLLISLFIAVLKTNTFHAYGIFIEWFLLPILTSFIISIYLKEKKENVFFIKKSLLFIFVLVNLIALFYWINNNLTYDHRLKAFYLSPNYLAMFITSLFFIIFSFIFEIENKKKKIFLFLTITISLIILFKTNSLINLFLVLFGLNLFFASFFKRRFIFITILFFTFIILFFSAKSKIPSWEILTQKNSIQSRIVIYVVTLNSIRSNLFFGKKIGYFQDEYLSQQKFYLPYPEWAVPTPHNFFLMNLFSAGLFFATLFYLICFYYIFIIFKNFVREKDKNKQKILFLYFLNIFIFLLQGVFDTPYWKNDLSLLFWMNLFLIFYLTKNKKESFF